MSDLTTLRASVAASERWAHEPDRVAATTAARRGLRAKWEREVDPDGVLPADELERRVALKQRAHMQRMTLAAANARRARREAKTRPGGDAA